MSLFSYMLYYQLCCKRVHPVYIVSTSSTLSALYQYKYVEYQYKHVEYQYKYVEYQYKYVEYQYKYGYTYMYECINAGFIAAFCA